MHVQIQKWGNSLAFRIPRTFAKEADIRQGTTVDIGIKKGLLIVTPIKNKVLLKDLVAKITKSNIHHEVDFGGSQGRELL
jgi:antitoxin MazE